MRPSYIIGFIFAVAVASAIYFFKDELFSKSDTTSWDFVPNSAAVIWEFDDPIATWNKFVETEHWKNLSEVTQFKEINSTLSLLDSLLGKQGKLDQIMRRGDFLVSMHMISSSDFDFIFYINLNNPEYQDQFLNVAQHFQELSEITISERTFSGQIIHEGTGQSNKIFSYIFYENQFVASFSPFLIEDVIRVSKEPESGFKSLNKNAFEQSSLDFDAGNVFLNLDQLSNYAGLFLKEKQLPIIEFLKTLGGSEFLDIEFDNLQFYLNGFLIPANKSSYLSVFSQQSPVKMEFEGLIPESTSILFYQSFSDPFKWHENLRSFWKSNDPNQVDSLNKFIKDYGFDLKRMTSWMNGHVVSTYQESTDTDPPKLLIISTRDRYESLNQLNKLAEKVNDNTGDTLYFENYSEHLIYLLNIDEFPEKIFGSWYHGYPQTYFTSIDDFIIISDDIEMIKELINNREDEFTWRQSISISKFLEHNLPESNIGMFINVPNSTGLINNLLSDKWKKYLDNHLSQFRQFEMIGIQYSNMGDRFYSSIVTNQRETSAGRVSTSIDFLPSVDFESDTLIRRKPGVVKNHLDNSREILIQDLNNIIYLVDRNGKQLWQKIIDGPIKGDLSQIDFYKNKKLQYLFATSQKLHLIDRNGDYVNGYPVALDSIDVAHVDVIDYNRSRNYRFLISDESGKVYLLNKVGETLEGWNPKEFGDRFDLHPIHLRVRSKDVFLAILENGIVHMTNRRGELMKGFPLNLDVRVSGDVFYKIKGGFKETVFEVISDEGELISFNLEGTVLDRKQLYKPSTKTVFTLIKEATGKSFVITRQDFGRLAIVDKYDDVRFEKDFPGDNLIGVQYYNFGSDKVLFIMQNVEPGVLLVYDGFGSFKSSRLLGDYPVSIIHHRSSKSYSIYTSQGNHLLIYTLKE